MLLLQGINVLLLLCASLVIAVHLPRPERWPNTRTTLSHTQMLIPATLGL